MDHLLPLREVDELHAAERRELEERHALERREMEERHHMQKTREMKRVAATLTFELMAQAEEVDLLGPNSPPASPAHISAQAAWEPPALEEDAEFTRSRGPDPAPEVGRYDHIPVAPDPKKKKALEETEDKNENAPASGSDGLRAARKKAESLLKETKAKFANLSIENQEEEEEEEIFTEVAPDLVITLPDQRSEKNNRRCLATAN